MNPRAGRSAVVIIGLLLAGAGPACDWISLVGEPEVPPPTSAPADSYDAMCLHYCQALEETDLLGCVSTGRHVDDCQAATAPTADVCFDSRCRSHRVDVALCLKQCDSLASLYDARCPADPPSDSSDPLCPTSRAEHDAACRAPCVL